MTFDPSEKLESISELLAAQCMDLESLFALSLAQMSAIGGRDYDGLARVTQERATLGERLESYRRQIEELRRNIQQRAGIQVMPADATAMTVKLIEQIRTQDARNLSALNLARSDTANTLQRLNKSRNHATAYLARGYEGVAVAFDQRA
jgi:hypothetical protein